MVGPIGMAASEVHFSAYLFLGCCIDGIFRFLCGLVDRLFHFALRLVCFAFLTQTVVVGNCAGRFLDSTLDLISFAARGCSPGY